MGEPTHAETSPSKEGDQLSSGDNSMKIAWRYQNLPKVQVSFCDVISYSKIVLGRDERWGARGV